MELRLKQCYLLMVTVFILAITTMIPLTSAANASVSIDYIKVGACNSTISVRVGDYCDHLVTITVGSSNTSISSTDLTVEIIMPDNGTIVMQMSKPSITYVGRNFVNYASLYQPTISMISLMNSSQFDNVLVNFGTIVNQLLVAPNNNTESSIMISFRTIVISSPNYQIEGALYWVTIGIEYNNVSEIWIGQSLFNFTNSSSVRSGPFTIGNINNSTLQVPQGSPFALPVPINYNSTFASNFVFTITNNNPSQIGLCSLYIQSATSGFQHLPTIAYEISKNMTTTLTNNQISMSLGQIINTESFSGSQSTLYITVYGRVFKTDSISSFLAGTLTAQVSSSTSATVTQTYPIYASSAIVPSSLNGSLPTLSLSQQITSVGIYQTLKLTVTMIFPSSFSAPIAIDLNGSFNTTLSGLKACAIIFQSAGENVANSNPLCIDQSTSRFTYTSSSNSSVYDQLSYDYGVLSNMGSLSTVYSPTANTVVFDAVYQLLNTTQSPIWPAISVTFGNNTLWLGTAAVNVTTINYNITSATEPTFSLSYETNNTANQSSTIVGNARLFYFDMYTKPTGLYTPMILKIQTNETSPGSGNPAASICLVRILYAGQNLRCFIPKLYNQDQSPFITYSSRYNKRKNDSATIELGPLCNSETVQTNDDFGRIRVGVYVKVESALADGQSTYVNLNIYYAPLNAWTGQILFTANQTNNTANVVGTPLFFLLNSRTQPFNINSLTVVNYGLKIPAASYGTYSSLTSSIINEPNQQTSVCRVDLSPNRGSNVPCSTDASSAFTYNANGYSSVATTNLGTICNIASNSSTLNSSLSLDSDTVIIQVFLLATSQTSSTFDLTLSNLIPYGQSALATLTSTFNGSSTNNLTDVSSESFLNSSNYKILNNTNNGTYIYLGQDVSIVTSFVLASNRTSQSCYQLSFQFSFTPSNTDAAYFTNAFFLSSGDNLMCIKAKSKPILSSGGSLIYNTTMYLDFGTICYYPIDPTNITANTFTIQANARIPMSTTIPINSLLSINTVALMNNNQSSVNTSISLKVQNHTLFSGFTVLPNETAAVFLSAANSTIKSGIRQLVTFQFQIYLPTYSQGRLQILIASIPMSSSVTVNIISADILSAGINVGSFMTEYLLGNKYQWIYSSSVLGSSYQDTAYLDLGVVSNTGTSILQNLYSNTTDNYIFVRAIGYLTDSPLAENNYTFSVTLTATYGTINISNSFGNVVTRNGTERPVMFLNFTDLTSGPYGIGSTYGGRIVYGHYNNSNAECINAGIIIYLPTWISLQNYNSTTPGVNYTSDNNSYVLFNLGTLLFNDAGSLTFTLNIGTSTQMALVYGRYYSPTITIPFELMCMKRARADVAYYPTSKVFAFIRTISLLASITSVTNYGTLLDRLDPCQFTSSVFGSDASLVRTTGWQTGYRSNKWMLSGSTYLQINFGNLTLVDKLQLTVPAEFAPISFLQLGYSWDGISFAVDTTNYLVNGSSSYTFPVSKPLLIQSLRIYLMDVVQPSDLLIKTSGFILNVTGTVNSTNATIANICSNTSNILSPRTILVAPSAQVGLTYSNDIYVCDETTTRTGILCHVLLNGDLSAPATWIALNTTVANINLFVYDSVEQLQSLYGYAQDGVSMIRSDDRGLTWSVTTFAEYSNMTAQCTANLKVCTTSDSYALMNGSPGYLQLQGGVVSWTASINGLWTQQPSGTLAFDWFGY